ncbi:MAG: hypothetical protein PGN13_15560 [Patulibacter minatonensis]
MALVLLWGAIMLVFAQSQGDDPDASPSVVRTAAPQEQPTEAPRGTSPGGVPQGGLNDQPQEGPVGGESQVR